MSQNRAETQVKTQQHQQCDEVPAFKHTVKVQQQNITVEGAVSLRVPGNLAPLGDDGARDGAQGDQHQEDDPETHGGPPIRAGRFDCDVMLLAAVSAPGSFRWPGCTARLPCQGTDW